MISTHYATKESSAAKNKGSIMRKHVDGVSTGATKNRGRKATEEVNNEDCSTCIMFTLRNQHSVLSV